MIREEKRRDEYTFLRGAQQRSRIALSHSYPNVVVIFADIVGTWIERREEEK
jgi:hypothetical protein